MQNKFNVLPGIWLMLLLTINMNISCAGKKVDRARMRSEFLNGTVQTKKIGNKLIVMELLPEKTDHNMYKFKLALVSNDKITDKALMQYFNFGVRNGLYAVQGNDTIPCSVCERIPGISEKELLYVVCFNKPAAGNRGNLHLFIADTIAGFGTTEFEIKQPY